MKLFNILILTTTMLLANGTVIAAKCKYEDDSVDKFTQVRTVSTRMKLLTSGMAAFGKAPKGPHAVYAGNVYASVEGDDFYLTLRILLENYLDFEPPPYELEHAILVPEDSHLLVLMSDGEILRLPVRKPYSFDATFLRPNAGGNSSKNDFLKTAEAYISYVLDEETAAALTAQDVTNIRIEAGETYYDIELTKKSRGDIREVIDCIQQAHTTEGTS
jgi:hypothetical protein